MWFISKRRLCKYMVKFIAITKKQYDEIMSSDADEALKRDAAMMHSGYISAYMSILNFLKGAK